ncbi:MAG: tRNA (N6-threonylcarbamoyladenosine(37)-N6)-methyltransferase TrmO [Promethearchaeota archaeon]
MKLDIEKLNRLLQYWIDHNKQHANEIQKWINEIKKFDFKITEDLEEVIKLFNKINKIIESSKNKINKIKNINSFSREIHNKQEIFSKQESIEIFKFKKIGTIHTPYDNRAPYQPIENDKADFYIDINPKYMDGLYKLEKFRYIYVIYYIHRPKKEFQNIISPPWTSGEKVGVFASRSPIRPNLIGLSVVRLKKIINNRIFTSGLDVFNGTPLIDIKPYIKDLDTKKDANYGWIEDLKGYEHLLLHIKGIPHDY